MPSNEIGAYYEKYWTSFGFNPTGYMKPELIRLFQSHLKPQSQCLDVGCGDGRTAGPWIIQSGRQYVGVDVSRPAVEAATAAGLTALHVSNTELLPFPDNHFDHVLCIEVLEHLFSPQLTVRELHRVLKSGGALIVTVPNVAYWRRRLELLLLGHWNPLGDDRSKQEPWRDPHIRFFTPSSLGKLLASCEFAHVRTGGHAGGLLRDLPWIGKRLTQSSGSKIYRTSERIWPTLFGYGAHAIATK